MKQGENHEKLEKSTGELKADQTKFKKRLHKVRLNCES